MKSSTMCVPLSIFDESFTDLYKFIDNIKNFIEKYQNSEGVGKDDANIGIIILNTSRKILDISFNQNIGINKNLVNEYAEKIKEKKYSVKVSFPSTLF